MKLFRTAIGRFVEEDGHHYRIGALTWDALLTHEDLEGCLESIVEGEAPTHEFQERRCCRRSTGRKYGPRA